MLPRFAVALPQDALLQSSPPFDYPGVSMRVFPLRSDLTRTQALVDGWLNDLLPPEVAYFRVFSPFVLLVALNYGKASVIPSNLGWSSQKEVTFSIPLQWYKRDKSGFVLHDFAFLTPFIFVDNDLSIPAGREVFGWQKNLIWLDNLGDRWLRAPRAWLKHAGISTPAFREVYAGKQQQRTPFVDIEEGPPGALFQYPPDLENPHLPWVALHNSVNTAAELSLDLVNLLTGLGLIRRRGVPRRRSREEWLDPNPQAILKMVQSTLASIDPYAPDLYTNEINLKQFRDAEKPTMACYQDINCTVMRIKEINRVGLLGEARILAGDLTGGFRVTLHQMASLPIADMLGLECTWSTDTEGATVAQLKPVLPMWSDMDLGYADERYVLAWRSKDHPWSTGRGAAVPALLHPTDRGAPRAPKAAGGIRYNTALGTSSPVLYGPFESPKATFRVLPLLATPEKLAEVVSRALNEPLHDVELGAGEEGSDCAFSFEPWGSYVYLVMTTSDATYAIDNNIGSWPTAVASFVIPVQRFTGGKPDGFALYSPFIFSASSLDSISSSEINGMRVIGAKIDSPQSTWLEENGPAPGRGRDLTVLRAMIPPILDAGERALTRTLLKIRQRSTDSLNQEVSRLSRDWPSAIRRDLERRPLDDGPTSAPGRSSAPVRPSDLSIARAHAIDFLADSAPFRFLALKQFRDVARPDRACYQALVEVRQRLSQIERIEEIECPLDVAIFDYTSMPIADMLGLVPRSTGYEGGLRYRKFEPIRPFWGVATLHEELGKTLAEQERSYLWVRRDDNGEAKAPSAAATIQERGADRLANLRRIDLGDPREIERKVNVERTVRPARPVAQAAAAHLPEQPEAEERDAMAALAAVEPQWVIEALLSREWESREAPEWLKHKKRIERECEQACSRFKAFTVRAFNEIQEMKSQRRKIPAPYHKDILEVIDALLLPRFAALTWVFAEALHLNEITHGTGALSGFGAQAVASAEAASRSVLSAEIHHFSGDGGAAHVPENVDTLYARSEFDALSKDDAELVARAEDVMLTDVQMGNLLKSLIDLSGEAGTSLIHEYTSKHQEAVAPKRSMTDAEESHFGDTPQDLFLHFSSMGDEPSWTGETESSPAGEVSPVKKPDLPRGLVEDLREEASGAIALMRTLVYLAWNRSHGGDGDKGIAWNGFLETAAREEKAAREALIIALAKCWQKPFFCVRRDTAGDPAVADEVFPVEDSWPDNSPTWYSPPGEGRRLRG